MCPLVGRRGRRGEIAAQSQYVSDERRCAVAAPVRGKDRRSLALSEFMTARLVSASKFRINRNRLLDSSLVEVLVRHQNQESAIDLKKQCLLRHKQIPQLTSNGDLVN